MNCETFQNNLDGLGRPRYRGFQKWLMYSHRRRCAACQALWETDREVEALLRQLPVLDCPEAVTARLSLITETAPVDRRKMIWSTARGRQWAFVSGAVAAAALIVITVFEIAPQQKLPEPASYSAEELHQAREQALWALGTAGKRINRAEKTAVEQVFINQLPKTMRQSLKQSLSMIKGG